MNWILMEAGFPIITIELEDREAYFEALRVAQRTQNTCPFVYFLYHVAIRSITRYIEDLAHLLPAK